MCLKALFSLFAAVNAPILGNKEIQFELLQNNTSFLWQQERRKIKESERKGVIYSFTEDSNMLSHKKLH